MLPPMAMTARALVDPPPEVRRAAGEDRSALAAVLARAFLDDPVTNYFYPSARTRGAYARRFFRVRLAVLGRQEQVWTTSDLAGAALWSLPGHWRDGVLDGFRLFPSLPGLLPHPWRALRGVHLIEERHPAAQHFYLSVIGTDPAHQGRGIGSALLRPVLDLCDREHFPAYLESSKERNVDFYARHGFRVRERITLPDGPPLWLMWREPR